MSQELLNRALLALSIAFAIAGLWVALWTVRTPETALVGTTLVGFGLGLIVAWVVSKCLL